MKCISLASLHPNVMTFAFCDECRWHRSRMLTTLLPSLLLYLCYVFRALLPSYPVSAALQLALGRETGVWPKAHRLTHRFTQTADATSVES